LTGRPGGSPYWIRCSAAAQPYVSMIRLPERVNPGNSVTLDFQMQRGVALTGRVTDKSTGKPLRSAVEYFVLATNPNLRSPQSYAFSATVTNEDGSYSLVALPGPGIVAAKLDELRCGLCLTGVGAERIKGFDPKTNGFATPGEFVSLINFNAFGGVDPRSTDSSVTCDLAIDTGKTVSGMILGPDGKPLSGVTITSVIGSRTDIRDLPTAKFTIPTVNPNHPQAYFFHHHQKKLAAAVAIKGDEPDTFAVKLEPTATVTGRLLDNQGDPLSKARIMGGIEPDQLNLKTGWYGYFWSTTNADGRFRIEGLIPGVTISASLERDYQRHGAIFSKLTLKAGEVRDLGDVKVKPE
jgi:protocatechuate 3,4-dioxygenase beta subunit